MEAYIVVFLLFFAVLAFAWFYFQRAKARATTAVVERHAEPVNRPSDPAP
ncbi:MAG: hypothetical protein ACR2H0_08580 [Candidatus Limnocylindrales bacterium]